MTAWDWPPPVGSGVPADDGWTTPSVKRRVVGMTAMVKVEPAGLGDLRMHVTAIAADLQEATVAQNIGRGPFTRRPGLGFFSGREAFEQGTLPIVRGGPSMHTDQLTPHPHALHRAERVAAGGGNSPGLQHFAKRKAELGTCGRG
ncbi:hypothetical protein ACIO8F_35610 [Streptomyces sp. NPDC087228]|uniref:hypothetical protein n=1 Tax=Streptomyces sp. NPDC087228 TaxID=3365772 RepID=UPI0038297E84